MKPKNLNEQISDAERSAAAAMCESYGALHGFEYVLTGIPPLPEPFTMGDVARAFLRAKLAELERIGAENAADAERVISIAFTPLEAEAVRHRLDMSDCFAQVFLETDGLEHLAVGSMERAADLARGLTATDTLTINGTELDAAIVREAIEGSTWNAVHDDEGEVSAQRRTAAARALTNAARKIEAALGLPENDITIPDA